MADEKKNFEENLNETEELGEWTKEMIKPENIVGVFKTTEEMLNFVLDEE